MQVYVTGPDTPGKIALVCVYDIFGCALAGISAQTTQPLTPPLLHRYFPQTQQGADIIASTLKTKVYMPDFFEPDGAFPISKFPPKTRNARLQNHTADLSFGSAVDFS